MTDTELQRIADQDAATRLNQQPPSTLSDQLAAIRFAIILRIVGMVLLAILAWSFIAGTILSTIYLIGILIASLL